MKPSTVDQPVDAPPRALFLTPESPESVHGGGLRSASLLAYLRAKYAVDVLSIDLPPHSRTAAARVSRNFVRLVRGRPPLFDRYSGHPLIRDGKPLQVDCRYSIAIVEHFWCASYANRLRPHADRLVLDLHNVESALARSCARGVARPAFLGFARAYERLEREYLPKFDVVLVTSEEDAARVESLCRRPARRAKPRVLIYPNAIHPNALCRNVGCATAACPDVKTGEAHAIVFSGNLEYYPNVEAVRWFRRAIWPRLRREDPLLEWRLVGANPHTIESIVAGDPRIRTVGPVANALAEIAAAKVAIVPLLSGSGTRFKILEAWAARRAVVSTTIGAEGLDTKPGEHLLIADDAERFAQAILTALGSCDLRSRLGECGHTLCESRFTWPEAWKALAEAGV